MCCERFVNSVLAGAVPVNRVGSLASGLVVLVAPGCAVKVHCALLASGSIVGSRLGISCWVGVKVRWELCGAVGAAA